MPDIDGSIDKLGFQPCEVEGTCATIGLDWPVDAVTANFAHGGWDHIAVNMLFLWIFGNNVEDALGRVRYLLFYLLAGFAAIALQAWVTLRFGSAAEATIPEIGASGAIAGVLGGYLILFPRARILSWVFPVFFLPVRACSTSACGFCSSSWSAATRSPIPSRAAASRTRLTWAASHSAS